MRELWIRFLNKNVTILKTANDKQFFYSGVIVDIQDNFLIIKDRKIGKIPLTYENLSLLAIRGDA